MANVSMGAYEAVLRIPQFLGLFQDGDKMNVDAGYAAEAVNVDTTGGVLAPAAKHCMLGAALPGPIGTLMRLHRRWHAAEGERDVLVAASGGKLYWMLPGGVVWQEIGMPEGIEAYALDAWSWATYEMNPEGSDAPVDILLLSNAKDGMVCVCGDTMTAQQVSTPKKFGVISRHAERIWGGAIDDDPDTLLYSAPFDPFNWEPNVDIPEDGAGDIQQPSWDGDSFTALVPFGAQLLAFKKSRVWRILGTDPGQYIFKEQYGGGAVAWDTVAVALDNVLLLGMDGLLRYNGMTVEPYYQQYARDVFGRMNRGALTNATACFYKEKYFCALPLDGSAVNNAVLVVNLAERTWLLRDGVTVKDFLPTDDALLFTSATQPGRVFRWGEDAAETGAEKCRWVSPWLDLGRMDCKWGGFAVRLAVVAKTAIRLTITIRTEKKAKTKSYIAPASENPKVKRLAFGGSGRRFRFEIEAPAGAAWHLMGGLQLTAEKEED